MGLDDGPGYPQEGRAAVFGGGELLFEAVERLFDKEGGQLGAEIGIEDPLEIAHEHVGGAFHGLKQHVAAKSIRHQHVHHSGGHVSGFDVAGIIESARFEQGVRLLLERPPL